MNTPKFFRALVLSTTLIGAAAPGFAQNHSGGGGHISGGGAHFAGHAAAPHFAAGAHYSMGAHYGYTGVAHFAAPGHFAAGVGVSGRFAGGPSWRGGYWHGGYWGGGYWPGVYYGPSFAWFLPVLPALYATYWWGGLPYYYVNDAYYTWNATDNGYVAADPPPVANGTAGGESAAAGATAGTDGVFAYPMNNQSEAQQATDRNECRQWASSQAGSGNADDLHRAMIACMEGRGYSAQ